MKFDKLFLDTLSSQAKSSSRLRVNYDLRNSEDDQSQRMLNALHPGTILPIHRHPETSETIIVIRGSVCEKYFDEDNNITDQFFLKAGTDHVMLHIPAGTWHTLECMEPGTIIFEAKDGAYHPISKNDIKQ